MSRQKFAELFGYEVSVALWPAGGGVLQIGLGSIVFGWHHVSSFGVCIYLAGAGLIISSGAHVVLGLLEEYFDIENPEETGAFLAATLASGAGFVLAAGASVAAIPFAIFDTAQLIALPDVLWAPVGLVWLGPLQLPIVGLAFLYIFRHSEYREQL